MGRVDGVAVWVRHGQAEYISFKTIAERDPLSTVRIFGHAPLPPGTRITPVEREVVTPIKSVDHAFLVESETERWIEHLEAETSLSGDDLVQIGGGRCCWR